MLGFSALVMQAVVNWSPALTAAKPGVVLVADLKGVIGVATGNQVGEVLERAREDKAALVVLRLDTPGGLVTSTRDVVQTILASPVPVAVYVSPSGAHAASAGTYIVYAAHIAAMAPGTHLGAATPIRLGGMPGVPDSPQPEPSPREGGEDTAAQPGDSAEEKKAINDAVAFLRSLAQLRDRNAEWAEKAVREAATLTAEDAVKARVIDLVARDVDDLLRQIDGRIVPTAAGDHRLSTSQATTTIVPASLKTRLFAVIADPNIAFILLLIGLYGILFELWTPGFIGPGVIGGICLVLGLTALTVLPVDYGGLALLLFGVALMAIEAFTPGIGIVGIGGLVAFIGGSLFLFDPSGADVDIRVAVPLVIAAAITSGVLLVGVFGFALKARRRPVVSGAEEMIGLKGRVISWQGECGRVQVHGEAWAARATRSFNPGDAVRVVGRDKLTVIVEVD